MGFGNGPGSQNPNRPGGTGTFPGTPNPNANPSMPPTRGPNFGTGPRGIPTTPNPNSGSGSVNFTPTESANSPFSRSRRPGFATRAAQVGAPHPYPSNPDNPLLPMGTAPGDPGIGHTPGFGLHDPNDTGVLPTGTPYAPSDPTGGTTPTGSAPTTPTAPSGPSYGGQAGTINGLYRQGLGPDGEPRGRQN